MMGLPEQNEVAVPHVLTAPNPAVLHERADAAVLAALRHCESKVLYRDAGGRHQELRLSPGLQPATVRGTRCFIHLEAVAPGLAGYLAPHELESTQVDRVNLYVSPPRAGAPLHFDVRTVLIVQLSGTKLWQVAGAPAVHQPTHNVVADEARAKAVHDGQVLSLPAEMHFALLQPGDWLLVPRGTWHATFSECGSVSATLALRDTDVPGVQALQRATVARVPPLGRRLPC